MGCPDADMDLTWRERVETVAPGDGEGDAAGTSGRLREQPWDLGASALDREETPRMHLTCCPSRWERRPRGVRNSSCH